MNSLYKVEPDKFEAKVAQQREKVLAGKYKHVSDHSDEWYTPAAYIREVKRVLGEIDLDPASCEVANKTIGATDYFTTKDSTPSQLTVRVGFSTSSMRSTFGHEISNSAALTRILRRS